MWQCIIDFRTFSLVSLDFIQVLGLLLDLDFMDDIALLSNTRDALQDITTGLQNNGTKVGLRISAEKTKAMIVGEHQAIPLTVTRKTLKM